MSDDIHKLKILICDDSMTSCLVLKALLNEDGFNSVVVITDPRQVVATLEANAFDLLMLDIEMPHLSGLDVIAQIKASPVSKRLMPIMVLTGRGDDEIREQAFAAGIQDFLNKPFNHTEVILRVRNILNVRLAYLVQLNISQQLEQQVAKRTKALSAANDALISRLAMAGEMRDNETGKHIIRVGKYSRILAEAYGLSPERCYAIEKAAPLHDVGKIGIPDNILLKPGKLTPEERKVMEKHTELGARLLAGHDSELVAMAASIALTHHERWDGLGYPWKLSGDSIPIEGRITAVADVFDALGSIRPYKPAWPLEQILQYFYEQKGKHFDPMLVDMLIQNLPKILEVRDALQDTIDDLGYL